MLGGSLLKLSGREDDLVYLKVLELNMINSGLLVRKSGQIVAPCHPMMPDVSQRFEPLIKTFNEETSECDNAGHTNSSEEGRSAGIIDIQFLSAAICLSTLCRGPTCCWAITSFGYSFIHCISHSAKAFK